MPRMTDEEFERLVSDAESGGHIDQPDKPPASLILAEARRAREAETLAVSTFKYQVGKIEGLQDALGKVEAEAKGLRETIAGMKAGEDWLQSECSRLKDALEEILRDVCDASCPEIARAALMDKPKR